MAKTMLRVKKSQEEDEPKVKKRPNNGFKAIIDIEDYNPELMANFANKVKFKKNRKVKIKGKITPDMKLLKGDDNEPLKTTII